MKQIIAPFLMLVFLDFSLEMAVYIFQEMTVYTHAHALNVLSSSFVQLQ